MNGMSNKFKPTYMATLISVAISAAGCTSSGDEPQFQYSSIPETEELEVVNFRGVRSASSRHTDDGFETGDYIYVYPLRSTDTTLPSENRRYRYNGSAFVKYGTTSDITKKPGETLTYFAINKYEQRNGNEFTLYSGYTDYLLCFMDSDDTDVLLGFAHFMPLLWIDIENAPSSIRKVTLLNVDNVVEVDGSDMTLSYDPLPGNEVEMSYSPTYGSYNYYLPPCVYPEKGEGFIRIYLTNGRTYLFGPPSDTRFEINNRYFWTADLSNARYETSISRGNGQHVNTVANVSTEAMTDTKGISLNLNMKPKSEY